MRIIYSSKGEYLKTRKHLLSKIYSGDLNYRDSTTPLLKLILSSHSIAASGDELIPVEAYDEQDVPVACALFIIASGMPDTLQVAFFEALPGRQAAVDYLMQEARQLARFSECRRIVIGMNGHVNNGLGFLAGPYDLTAGFGSSYNPEYYIKYFESTCTSQETLISYHYDLEEASLDRERALIERIGRRFTVREGNFRDLRAEIAIYTHLNNLCFKAHPLYFERSVEEDYTLFKSFGPFLKEENFLVSEHEGRAIGFLLWYPDFNELVKPGKRLGLLAALKYRLPGHPISSFKIAEIGVIPEYQDSGAIVGLIDRCSAIARRNGHSYCESGWVFDSNSRSNGICRRWTEQPLKRYRFFEIDTSRCSL